MSLEIGETPLSVAEEPLLPVRMLNEFAYCPRLAYLEWVQSEFADSADTVEGRSVWSLTLSMQTWSIGLDEFQSMTGACCP
jgi:hypothetical protein